MIIFRMWWTITGNYGNILPIDWSKSYVHKLQTESLNLQDKRVSISSNAEVKYLEFCENFDEMS